jgi:hypothetical protein
MIALAWRLDTWCLLLYDASSALTHLLPALYCFAAAATATYTTSAATTAATSQQHATAHNETMELHSVTLPPVMLPPTILPAATQGKLHVL